MPFEPDWCVWGHEGEYPCISQEEQELHRRVQGASKEQVAASIREMGSMPRSKSQEQHSLPDHCGAN